MLVLKLLEQQARSGLNQATHNISTVMLLHLVLVLKIPEQQARFSLNQATHYTNTTMLLHHVLVLKVAKTTGTNQSKPSHTLH